jgi:hypothetical protein
VALRRYPAPAPVAASLSMEIGAQTHSFGTSSLPAIRYPSNKARQSASIYIYIYKICADTGKYIYIYIYTCSSWLNMTRKRNWDSRQSFLAPRLVRVLLLVPLMILLRVLLLILRHRNGSLSLAGSMHTQSLKTKFFISSGPDYSGYPVCDASFSFVWYTAFKPTHLHPTSFNL